MQERLKALILQQQEPYEYMVRAVETMPDHVHLLVSVSPTNAVNLTIGRLKGFTARMLREEFPILKRMPCLWTRAKFVASTGGVTLDVIKQYVENQKNV